MKVPSDVVKGAAGLFIVSRIFFTAIYMIPALNGKLRTFMFVIGITLAIGLLISAANRYDYY